MFSVQTFSSPSVIYRNNIYSLYLSSLKSLDKYMASLDHKISNTDLPSQMVNFMKCFKNYRNVELILSISNVSNPTSD
jgi:hypothetical protein